MDRENLESTIRGLPQFVPYQDCLVGYQALLDQFDDWRENKPDIVAPIRPLVRSREGRWIYVQTIGNGQLHAIRELMPHGGELFWLAAASEEQMLFCEHPRLLDGRTIHYLLAGPDETIRNLESWATKSRIPAAAQELYFYGAFGMHYRHPHPMENDHWSWPLEVDDRVVNSPTPGAIAGMKLVHELAAAQREDPRVKLVLWVAGHNRLVGYGTQFIISGPNAQASAMTAEMLARRHRVPLDPGPADDLTMLARHPGTKASWHYPSGAAVVERDATAQVGGNPYDYAKRFFPDLVVQASEIPMLRPKKHDPSGLHGDHPWDHNLTLDQAQWQAQLQTKNLDRYLAPLIKLAEALPDDDPYVSATRALAGAQQFWGQPSRDSRPGDTVLSAQEAFNIICAGPLHQVRAAAPATSMVWRNLDLAREKATDMNPGLMAAMLFHQICRPLDQWHDHLEEQPIRQAVILQILAAEVAFYGALGIRPRLRRRRKE